MHEADHSYDHQPGLHMLCRCTPICQPPCNANGGTAKGSAAHIPSLLALGVTDSLCTTPILHDYIIQQIFVVWISCVMHAGAV